MGFLKNLFGGSSETEETTVTDNTAENLETYKVSLKKTMVNLSKEVNIDFNDIKSRVKLVMDYSGSMSSMYMAGEVQEVITKCLPMGLQFDDDQSLDCYMFSNDAIKCKKCCTIDNYKSYVKTSMMHNPRISMLGTCYEPVLKILRGEVISSIPDFVIFITDGDNFDKDETDSILREMSELNCFILFVGIGNADFNYLEKIDNLDGRNVDNTGFVKFSDINSVETDELYRKMLTEYSKWYKEHASMTDLVAE